MIPAPISTSSWPVPRIGSFASPPRRAVSLCPFAAPGGLLPGRAPPRPPGRCRRRREGRADPLGAGRGQLEGGQAQLEPVLRRQGKVAVHDALTGWPAWPRAEVLVGGLRCGRQGRSAERRTRDGPVAGRPGRRRVLRPRRRRLQGTLAGAWPAPPGRGGWGRLRRRPEGRCPGLGAGGRARPDLSSTGRGGSSRPRTGPTRTWPGRAGRSGRGISTDGQLGPRLGPGDGQCRIAPEREGRLGRRTRRPGCRGIARRLALDWPPDRRFRRGRGGRPRGGGRPGGASADDASTGRGFRVLELRGASAPGAAEPDIQPLAGGTSRTPGPFSWPAIPGCAAGPWTSPYRPGRASCRSGSMN